MLNDRRLAPRVGATGAVVPRNMPLIHLLAE